MERLLIFVTIQVDTDDAEPSRIIPRIDGKIFEYVNEDGDEQGIGRIRALLVQARRAANEGGGFV